MTDFSPRSESDHIASLSVALAPHKSGRHVVRHLSPNSPFFYLGDTAWELPHRLSMEEAEFYLRNRADKGFNVVMVVLLAEHGGLDYPNRNGDWPFFPSAESTDESYIPDLLRPNPAYFAFIDSLIPLAASLGITLALVPTWGRYVNGGYYGSPILFNTANAEAYGRFLGERYPFHPWILGGDSNRYWNVKTLETVMNGGDSRELEVVDYGDVTEAMAKGLLDGEQVAREALKGDIKVKAEGYEPFITYHSAQPWLPKAAEAIASAQFPTSKWLTLDCIQSGHHDGAPSSTNGSHAQAGAGALPMWQSRSGYLPVRKMYATSKPGGGARPVIDLEAHYEATHHFFQLDQPIWGATDIRAGGYQALFAGASGYTYGCNSIWQMHNAESKSHPPIAQPTTAYTNWYHELDLPGSFQAGIMRRIFLSLPSYFTSRPDQSMIVSDTNEGQGDKLISGLRGDGWAMVHLPYGGTVDVDISKALPDLKDGKGWRGWWIDPKSGGRSTFGIGEETGAKSFEAPSGGSLECDWILLLEEVGLPWEKK
ncbi:hypothetical protein BCR39DRAFT_320021 [Naematelia encephala]|uniref:DUF4038 domain-containing protein n=1 Tax=Naematelia encephala TaxID=71784 RepID=A0A1Y2AQS7_9TREE|nr:hypothetical protein BCR39DRAFT_320021 [Naematelia encephala]